MAKKEIFIPKEDRVVVKQLDAETRTKGGIIIPDSVQERPHKGLVIRIGPDVDNTEPGELIMYGKYAGTEFKEDGQELILMRKTDIMGEFRTVEVPDENTHPSGLSDEKVVEAYEKHGF